MHFRTRLSWVLWITVLLSFEGCVRLLAPAGSTPLDAAPDGANRDAARDVAPRDGDATLRDGSPPCEGQRLSEVPVVTEVLVSGSAVSADPPSPAELTIPQGKPLYVKWRAEDPEGLAPRPIGLYVTSDDRTYTLFADQLQNGPNAGCTVNEPGTPIDDRATGCFVGVSPTSGYYRVRVLARDPTGMIGAAISEPLNAAPLHLLAGNPESGTDTSAVGALFFGDRHGGDWGDPGSMVLTNSGEVYFRDVQRGLLAVDPRDGILRVLVPTTGVSAGDGGPLSAATLRLPHKIALDHQRGLLIFDHDRIRRIDLAASPMTIDTLIGGGSSTADVAGPREVAFTPPDDWDARQMPLIALPQGDIYFQSDHYSDLPQDGHRIRVYRASTQKVESIKVSGVGDSFDPSQDLSLCPLYGFGLAYDPKSSKVLLMQISSYHEPTIYSPSCGGGWAGGEIHLDPMGKVLPPPTISVPGTESTLLRNVGRDGRIYGLNRPWGDVFRYDVPSKAWQHLGGTDDPGDCVDGTPALTCGMEPLDVAVTETGTVHLVDRGRIRRIDPLTLTMQTVMGQRLSSGDGGRAVQARMSFGVSDVELWTDASSERLVLLDVLEARLRELTPGGTIQTIAGTGAQMAPALGSPATSQGLRTIQWGNWHDQFAVHPLKGDVYFNRGSEKVARLDRATGVWSDVIGGGSIPYQQADGRTGAEVQYVGTPLPRIVGLSSSALLVGQYRQVNEVVRDNLYKLYTFPDFTQSHLVGKPGKVTSEDFCNSGATLVTCSAPYPGDLVRAQFDNASGSWLLAWVEGNHIRRLSPGGLMATLTTVDRSIVSLAYRNDGSTQILYYCATDGRLYARDLKTNTEQTLPWPIPSLSCQGYSLVYNAKRKSLIFPVFQSGLGGVAEYLLP